MERRGLATDVLAQRVDLVARHVELVAALVRDEQVVAFDAADVALDHSLVLADAVLVVDDVVAGLQVFERAGAVAALARPGGAVRPSPAGEVALGDDRHLGVRQRAPAMERRHDDRSAGLERHVVRRGDDREVEAVAEQQLAEAADRPCPVGRDDDAEPPTDQLGQAVGESRAVARDRPPAGRLDERRLGRFRRGIDRPERAGLLEQGVGIGVQTRELSIRIAGPGRREGAGEVVLLGDQIERPVTHATRFDEQQLRRVGQDVGEQTVVLHEPGHPALHAVEVGALRQSFPLLPAPRFGLDELGCRRSDVLGRHQLAGGEDAHLGDVADRALVVHPERGQPVDLVAPQVDADRCVGGRRDTRR